MNDKILTLEKNIDNCIVQKSRPLEALWKSKISLSEFKILDVYLARINSHNPEQRSVLISRGEIEKALDVKQIKKDDLMHRLTNLMGKTVEIPIDGKNEFEIITLFERVAAKRENDGYWSLVLECTPSAKKYFFNVENLGYYRYKLRCVKNITSRQTYVLFNYLESNRIRKSWDVSLEELKKILNCDNETYAEYKYFNRSVLKKVHKEITKKTECKYDYEPIKRGRTVVGIKFTVYPLHDLETLEEPETLEAYWGSTDLWQEPLEVFAFSPEELEEIRSVLITVPAMKLPQGTAGRDSLDIMRYHYIDQKTKEIIRRDKQKPIKSKCAYLIKMIRQDSDQLPGQMDITDYAGVVPE